MVDSDLESKKEAASLQPPFEVSNRVVLTALLFVAIICSSIIRPVSTLNLMGVL